jgi:chemotaxis response regulator CheB
MSKAQGLSAAAVGKCSYTIIRCLIPVPHQLSSGKHDATAKASSERGGIIPGHDIIVVGVSANGVEALVALAGMLPRNLPAAVFVDLHIPAQSPSLMPDI